MKKKITHPKRQRRNKIQKGAVGNIFIFGILLLLILLALSVIGGPPSVESPLSGTQVQITTPTPNTTHNTLQLETFGYTTIAPTAVATQIPNITLPAQFQQPVIVSPTYASNLPLCTDEDDGVIAPATCQCPAETLECINSKFKIFGPNGSLLLDCVDNPSQCGAPLCGVSPYAANGKYCVAKPVIYLYPTVPTTVSVQVLTSGTIVVSNPAYPQGGWKNVLALPSGTLQYNNQDYSELFYESSVASVTKPSAGIVIPAPELVQNLNGIISKLGLIGSEKKEFISYWVPKLQALHSPYIFFSFFSPAAKSAIDHIDITPKPDTQIAFIAYFKPVKTPNYGSVLILPPTPKRVGFTSVEWGGVLDQ